MEKISRSRIQFFASGALKQQVFGAKWFSPELSIVSRIKIFKKALKTHQGEVREYCKQGKGLQHFYSDIALSAAIL